MNYLLIIERMPFSQFLPIINICSDFYIQQNNKPMTNTNYSIPMLSDNDIINNANNNNNINDIVYASLLHSQASNSMTHENYDGPNDPRIADDAELVLNGLFDSLKQYNAINEFANDLQTVILTIQEIVIKH